jgi:glutathione peroxidase
MNITAHFRSYAVAFLIFGGLMSHADSSIYDLKVKRIDGSEESLGKYKGKTLVIVNTASKCGYTPQYQGLEKLYETYKDRGVVVLGFPSNDFGGQEPGSNKEIQSFCKLNYGVTFPLFEKSPVTGSQKNPVFKTLLALSSSQAEIHWNFEKFVVSPTGEVLGRFPSSVEPQAPTLIAAVEKGLKK